MSGTLSLNSWEVNEVLASDIHKIVENKHGGLSPLLHNVGSLTWHVIIVRASQMIHLKGTGHYW